MARALAERWLEENSAPEYRLRVYHSGSTREKRAMPNLLRSFRDGKFRIAKLAPIDDLGIREAFDHFVVWSSNREAMIQLKDWFEGRGFETSGIW